jgi:hypothetical protein
LQFAVLPGWLQQPYVAAVTTGHVTPYQLQYEPRSHVFA